MNPVSSGYADVNGIKLCHEVYGQGEPLVLIHGGLTTISEMQGHGRTADTDRPMSFATMGDDIAALLDHLKIPKADLGCRLLLDSQLEQLGIDAGSVKGYRQIALGHLPAAWHVLTGKADCCIATKAAA
jgi:hypothetical protein